MSRLYKAYASAYAPMRPHYSELEAGEVATYAVDWNGIINDLGTSASTCVWSSDSSGVVSIGSSALSSGVASVPITASASGSLVMTALLTMANSAKREQKFVITVNDTR